MINYYCYIDGSWVDENRRGGIGWILYDSQNIPKIQGSTSTEATNSVIEIEEALALKEAIIQINKLSYQNVMFCGDSAILYNQLERVTKEEYDGTSPKNVSIQTHLDDIMKLIEGKRHMFKHVKREENMRADHLAILARNKNSSYVVTWLF